MNITHTINEQLRKRKGVFARLVCVSARMATRQSGDNEDEDDDDDDDDDEPVPKR